MKLKLALLSLLAVASSAEAVVTLSIKNYVEPTSNGAANGLPIVDSQGVPIAAGNVWASAGYFTTLPNFATASPDEILENFVSIDLSGISGITLRPGLFNGQDYSDAGAVSYPAGFTGKQLYVVFGDAQNVMNSDKIAVFDSGSVFTNFTAGGAQTAFLDVNSRMYGAITPVTVQPDSDSTPSLFVNGVQLVPEPTTALLGSLGMLGLLRRRRK